MDDKDLRDALSTPSGRRAEPPGFDALLHYRTPRRRLRRAPIAAIGVLICAAALWPRSEPAPIASPQSFAVTLPTYTAALAPRRAAIRAPSTLSLRPNLTETDLERTVQ